LSIPVPLLVALALSAPPDVSPSDSRNPRSLAEAGDPRAAEAYERAIAAAPGNLPLRVEFADYLWHVGERDRGNEQMESVIRMAPDEPRLKAHYGVNLAGQGRFADAAEQLDSARRGGFDNADVLYYLGSALWETGRLDEAAERLRQATEKAPEKMVAHHRLGRLFIFQGKPALAVAELTRAVELDPSSVEVLLDLGRAQEAAGETARAEASYRRALELGPDVPLAHYLLGTLLARTSRRTEAAEHIAVYRRAFQSDQQERYRAGARQAELNLGWTELKKKHYERALAQFRRHPDDVEGLRGAAQALSALGRQEEAVRALERAVLREPENRALRFELDKAREKRGKK
jgi:protein O-GlcNAc transferase